jgi:hypothetical protein
MAEAPPGQPITEPTAAPSSRTDGWAGKTMQKLNASTI